MVVNWFLVILAISFHIVFCEGITPNNAHRKRNLTEHVDDHLMEKSSMNRKLQPLQNYLDNDYHLTVTSSSPAVLDSFISFHAVLQIQGKDVYNETLFRYIWHNTANEDLQSTEANFESHIQKQFYSLFIDPGIYEMKVQVHKKQPKRLIALKTLKFNLTRHLNGRLNLNQHLPFKHDKFVFATKKPISLSSVLTDVMKSNYTYVYVWYANSSFFGWNQTGNVIYPGGDTVGNLNITVRVKASPATGELFKEGVFTQHIELKNEINITDIKGVGEVHEGQPLTVNVTYNGSNPAEICWHIVNPNRSNINCSTVYFGNKYTIYLPSDQTEQEGTYKLNITAQNAVSKVRRQTSFTVVDNNGHKSSDLVAIPVAFCIVGLLVTVSALAYAVKSRKKSHLTEVADFNFHPHIKSRSKVSIVIRNLVNQFMERGEYDSRRSSVSYSSKRTKSYGSMEDSESQDDCRLFRQTI